MNPLNSESIIGGCRISRMRVVASLIVLLASCSCKGKSDVSAPAIISSLGRLAFTLQPTNTTADTVQAVVVTAQDSLGNTIPDFTSILTLRLTPGTGVPGARLTGDTAVAALDGIATFAGLAIDSAGSGYTLQVDIDTVTLATSDTFSIAPGAASQLAFTTQPQGTATGVAFGAVVEVRDSQGNTAGSYGGDVTVAIASGTGASGANLTGATTLRAGGGVATFYGLTIDSAGRGYQLTATAPGGIGSATSSAFDIGPGAIGEPPTPVYNPATQTLLFSDNFDTYTTFADVLAGGWQGINAGTSQDYSTDAVNGANLVITDTIPANTTLIGKAIRLKYDGIAQGSTGQEGHAWGRAAGFDTLAGKPGHAVYVSYRVRIVPVAYNLDTDDGVRPNGHIIKVKWLELWQARAGNRAQFHTSYSQCYNDAPHSGWSGGGTLWGFIGRSAETRCNAGQARAPWAYRAQVSGIRSRTSS